MLWLMVHIPKTAGTSFRKAMREHFGDALLLDYGDKPMKMPPWKRNWRAWRHGLESRKLVLPDEACVFGHYLPLKYWALALRRPTRRVTWLRDPIARMVSNYWFIFERHRRKNLPPGRSRVVDEGWTLERFMFSPIYRDYCHRFLWGVPLRRFDFVGVVEHYAEDLAEFGTRFLGRELPVHAEKRGPARPPCPFLDDPEQRRRAEAFHARDMALYRQALALRERRRAAFSGS
jgi:hypothetical protein